VAGNCSADAARIDRPNSDAAPKTFDNVDWMTLDDSVALLADPRFSRKANRRHSEQAAGSPDKPGASQHYFTRREHVRLREFEDYAIRDRPSRIDMLD
jgi:hypothetical protein